MHIEDLAALLDLFLHADDEFLPSQETTQFFLIVNGAYSIIEAKH